MDPLEYLTSRILWFFATLFYLPNICLLFVYRWLAYILLKSAENKVGHSYYGLRSKLAFKLIKRMLKANEEIFVDTVAFATQIKGEEIMKAIRADKAYEFVCKDERSLPESEQTTFMCKFLDPHTAASLSDQLYNVQGVGQARKERLMTGTQQLNILKKCLVGWRNMKDEDGKEISFDDKKPIEMVAMIPPKYRREIVDFIQGESEVVEGEEQS
jgi:hypothetical protein